MTGQVQYLAQDVPYVLSTDGDTGAVQEFCDVSELVSDGSVLGCVAASKC